MQKNIGTLIFNMAVAVALFLLGGFLGFSEDVAMPSPYGSAPKHLNPPATYFICALPLGMGALILIKLTLPKIAARYGAWLFIVAITLFLIGYAIS